MYCSFAYKTEFIFLNNISYTYLISDKLLGRYKIKNVSFRRYRYTITHIRITFLQ